MSDIIYLSWDGMYDSSWKGLIAPAAISHPAKFARNLIKKIYDFAFEEGLLQEGDVIVDPFAGVALGSLDALLKGCHWVGCELEPRFAQLAQENIDLWNKKYGKVMRKFGTAKIVCGDSRFLSRVLKENHVLDGIVGSPPYIDSVREKKDDDTRLANLPKSVSNKLSKSDLAGRTYGTSDGQLSQMAEGNIDTLISSPPFTQPQTRDRSSVQEGSVSDFMTRAYTVDRQGGSDGNLANLEMDAENLQQQVDLIASSPPYANSLAKGDGMSDGDRQHRISIGRDPDAPGGHYPHAYSENEGNLGNLRDEGVAAIVGSPPYASARIGSESGQSQVGHHGNYGTSDGQLGSMPDEGLAQMVVTSPPFMDSDNRGQEDSVTDGFRSDGQRRGGKLNRDSYGKSDGQLGNLPSGEIEQVVDLSISSPPYEGSEVARGDAKQAEVVRSDGMYHYGSAEGQIGETRGDTFWSAAKQIVQECFALLKEGGEPVMDGEGIEFCEC